MVALIGCCLMLQPISTDLYLASLPGLTRVFAASITTVQWTLSVWIAAFGTMQLVAGPLSDRHGRRPVLDRGSRTLRAGQHRLRARAVDRHADPRAGLPGGRLLRRRGRRARAGPRRLPAAARERGQSRRRRRFSPSAPSSAPSWAASSKSASDSGPRSSRTRCSPARCWRRRSRCSARPTGISTAGRRGRATLLANYAFVLRSPEFGAYTLVGSASYGGLFAFLSGSSFVLIRVLAVPTAWFGFAFAFCVCGYLAGTLLCRHRLARMSVQQHVAHRRHAVARERPGDGGPGCRRGPSLGGGARCPVSSISLRTASTFHAARPAASRRFRARPGRRPACSDSS